MKPRITLRQALVDPQLIGSVLAGDSWATWKCLLIASMGEALTDREREVFKRITGGPDREPTTMVEEMAGIIGRRGGKTRAISVLATYIAGLCEHPALVRGERGVLLIIAPDQRQADIVLDHIDANFRGSPVLVQMIETRTARELYLTNKISIEVRAADFRRLRGPTYIGVIADEVAFWLTDYSSNPDDEILDAVRPGLSTTGGPLIMISSPYARRGVLWSTYDKHFGPGGDDLILVAQGSSRTFNPSFPQSVVDRAMARDPAKFSAEYGAEFRRDIESFVSIEAVAACVSRGVFERAPAGDVSYVAFVDPSGGSNDSMTLGIAHRAKDVAVLDCVRERHPPFNPDEVTREFADVIKSYGVGARRSLWG